MSEDDKPKISLIEKAVAKLNNDPAEAGRGSAPAQPTKTVNETRLFETPATPHKGDSVQKVDIDLVMLEEKGFVTPDGERSNVAEEFRFIKRPLLENAFGRNADLIDHGNLIMVTSANAGEGKTWTAINLAMSIAMEMDKTVLLVDADVGRAQVHKTLGTPLGPGLIDLLTEDNIDVGDVILRTSLPKLRVIPMGRFHPHANELLAGRRMLQLCEELAMRYSDRVVIFDSPPLLMTNEAVVLAGLMGQIVFVVESDKTPQSNVKDALSLLDTSKPIGLVLNKVSQYMGDYYGYGSYNYGEHQQA